MSNIKRIVGLVVKAPKLAQIMLNIHELTSATVPSQIFSGTEILAKNPTYSVDSSSKSTSVRSAGIRSIRA